MDPTTILVIMIIVIMPAVFYFTYNNTKETAFRSYLKAMGLSNKEIEKAVIKHL